DAARDDPDMRYRRRLVDAKDLEAVEIVLLDAPVLEADLAIFGEAQPHHGRAFNLRINALGVRSKTAIDRGVDARHAQLSLVVDRDLDDGGDIAQEAPVHGYTLAMPRRQLFAPFRLVGNKLDDAPQPRRIDRVGFERVAVIGVFGGWFDEPRRPEKLDQHVLGVASRRVGKLGNKRLYRKSMRNVRHRT